MNVQTLFRRLGLTGVTTLAAFVSGAAVDPAPAGAHCGGHDWSCGITNYPTYTYCNQVYFTQVYDAYVNDCSGTCYNGGTAGCCESPEACADAPCKPGGCGGPCAYLYSWEEWTGMTC